MSEQEMIPFTEVAEVQERGDGLVYDKMLDTSRPDLILAGKGVVKLLPRIGKFTTATRIYLGLNHLEELPKDFGSLVNLTCVSLRLNKLKDLPASFAKLTKLRDVNLSSNCLTRMPTALKSLSSIEFLKLDDNPFEETIEFPSNWNGLKFLSFSGCNQDMISPTINSLTDLGVLNIGNNYWKTLPNLDGLANLEFLDMSDMIVPLQKFPDSLANLRSLDEIQCQNSGLRHLPEWIDNLRSLRQLELSGNCLTELPTSIGRLPNLTLLGVANNKLSCVPKTLALNRGLLCLDIQFNPISSFPNALFVHNPGLDLCANCPKKADLTKIQWQPNNVLDCIVQPQSLAKLAARRVASLKKKPINKAHLPESCLELISTAKECSTLYCRGTFVRGGGIEGTRLVRFGGSISAWNTEAIVHMHTCDFHCTDVRPLNRC